MMIAAPIEEVVTSHILTAQRVEQLWSDRFANCLRKGGAFNKHSFLFKESKCTGSLLCFSPSCHRLHLTLPTKRPNVCSFFSWSKARLTCNPCNPSQVGPPSIQQVTICSYPVLSSTTTSLLLVDLVPQFQQLLAAANQPQQQNVLPGASKVYRMLSRALTIWCMFHLHC